MMTFKTTLKLFNIEWDKGEEDVELPNAMLIGFEYDCTRMLSTEEIASSFLEDALNAASDKQSFLINHADVDVIENEVLA